MIVLKDNELVFSFPHLGDYDCCMRFMRTIRIPDDNSSYSLPPGLGRFPLKKVDDYQGKVPQAWHEHGGVFLPMHEFEAMWISFSSHLSPCAVKVAAGKINAVTGDAWKRALSDDPQDYLVLPEQPWLDGFNVGKDLIRQFVAMPLGEGYSVEEQLTGQAEHGGLQLVVYPMKEEHYQAYLEEQARRYSVHYCSSNMEMCDFIEDDVGSLGLGAGGLMKQSIEKDPFGLDCWDQERGHRCFVHLVSAEDYARLTGEPAPKSPVTAKVYNDAGLPWFELPKSKNSVSPSAKLASVQSVAAKHVEKTGQVMPGNASVEPKHVQNLSPWVDDEVREGEF